MLFRSKTMPSSNPGREVSGWPTRLRAPQRASDALHGGRVEETAREFRTIAAKRTPERVKRLAGIVAKMGSGATRAPVASRAGAGIGKAPIIREKGKGRSAVARQRPALLTSPIGKGDHSGGNAMTNMLPYNWLRFNASFVRALEM